MRDWRARVCVLCVCALYVIDEEHRAVIVRGRILES